MIYVIFETCMSLLMVVMVIVMTYNFLSIIGIIDKLSNLNIFNFNKYKKDSELDLFQKEIEKLERTFLNRKIGIREYNFVKKKIYKKYGFEDDFFIPFHKKTNI